MLLVLLLMQLKFLPLFPYYEIIAELAESKELTLISSFICLLITKVHMGKLE